MDASPCSPPNPSASSASVSASSCSHLHTNTPASGSRIPSLPVLNVTEPQHGNASPAPPRRRRRQYTRRRYTPWRRDEVAAMRILKACEACRRRRVKCHPSHERATRQTPSGSDGAKQSSIDAPRERLQAQNSRRRCTSRQAQAAQPAQGPRVLHSPPQPLLQRPQSPSPAISSSSSRRQGDPAPPLSNLPATSAASEQTPFTGIPYARGSVGASVGFPQRQEQWMPSPVPINTPPAPYGIQWVPRSTSVIGGGTSSHPANMVLPVNGQQALDEILFEQLLYAEEFEQYLPNEVPPVNDQFFDEYELPTDDPSADLLQQFQDEDTASLID